MSQNNKLLYCVVSRGNVVLAEHSIVSGNAHLLAVRILEKLDSTEDTRVTYTQERYMFHVLIHSGITYLVVSEESFGRRIPFSFLEDIKQRFVTTYGESSKEAVAYEFNSAFSKVLAERMSFYANDPSADVINRVQGQIGEVKNIMIENIEKVLERGEKLDLLVDRTEVLQQGALVFRREGRRMHQVMWWRNVRLWVFMSLGVAAILYFILALACGFTLKNC
ncbi:hypothetical protein CEUSTIGMA_g8430.t1 [Chlamydomonas eustigma]|uniref:V-SNARE coiled-coil homology domain-containing protein n=1 Tax=Chlamydomonas eustigma TaxID=1157962 RepID=A0A250XD42_9CHLO|nr:hypothetical protein CEUSTIGMA_g8430.t1 [Chlamydomonas eustigma]|eukprot:GAX80995.1 hypothetical protein CEUSTIGMA_g8430.t1 [Chlamydomonas eustigma]